MIKKGKHYYTIVSNIGKAEESHKYYVVEEYITNTFYRLKRYGFNTLINCRVFIVQSSI